MSNLSETARFLKRLGPHALVRRIAFRVAHIYHLQGLNYDKHSVH